MPTEASIPAPRRAPFAGFLKHGLKPVVFALCLLPFAWLVYRTFNNQLGANPFETIIRYLGDWALRFLLIALAVTPLRIITGWLWVARLRRMLGLFAFAYVAIHVFAYVGEHAFNWSEIWGDIVKRTYITVGMAALTMLTPLAATSMDWVIRRMGGAAWRKLHLLVYPAAILGVIHYFLMIKAGYQQPLIYGVILAALFGVCLYKNYARRI